MAKTKPDGSPAEPAKLPIPKDGVRARNVGRTWWGRRWLELFERAAAELPRELEAARLSARQGRVRDVKVEDGIATAEVVTDRRYRIELRLVPFVGSEWERVAKVLVQQAGFEAALLARQLPEELASLLERAGFGLFPADANELTLNCQCPVWSQPCEHVLAAGLVLGAAVDEDPLLLFELRGRPRAELLEDLARHRAQAATAGPPAATAGPPAATAGPPAGTAGPTAGTAGTPAASAEDRRLVAPEAWKGLDRAAFRAADPALEGLAFRFDPAAEPLAVLQRLGLPPDVDEKLWKQRLEPAYLRAVQRALELAMGQKTRPEPDEDEADDLL